MSQLNWREQKKLEGEGIVFSELVCKTLFAWEEPVSPHLAAERESGPLKDSVLLQTLHECFRDVVESGIGKERSEVLCVVETAGGVASPGPSGSGSLQCDLYRYDQLLLERWGMSLLYVWTFGVGSFLEN